jgi:hypothetical protein
MWPPCRLASRCLARVTTRRSRWPKLGLALAALGGILTAFAAKRRKHAAAV